VTSYEDSRDNRQDSFSAFIHEGDTGPSQVRVNGITRTSRYRGALPTAFVPGSGSAGVLHSVAASLREPATPFRMTIYFWVERLVESPAAGVIVMENRVRLG